MLFSVKQAFVGRDENRAPLKTPAWEATFKGSARGLSVLFSSFPSLVALPSVARAIQKEKTGDESVVAFI